MKRIHRWFREIFSPKDLHGLDVLELQAALNDAGVRKIWLWDLFQELKRMNLEVDRRLLSGPEYQFADLCARRKAYQDVLEGILSAKRQASNHNPQTRGQFDLESVTG